MRFNFDLQFLSRSKDLRLPQHQLSVFPPSSFRFKGFCEYLEDLVAQIDAPRSLLSTLVDPYIKFPSFPGSSVAQNLKPPGLSSVRVQFIPWVNICIVGSEEAQAGEGSHETQSHISSPLFRNGLGCLHTVQILQQLSASLSKVVKINVVGPAPPSDEPPFGGSLYAGSLLGGSMFDEGLLGKPLLELPGVPDRIDRLDRVEFLRPFAAVNELVLRGELSENIIHALELAKGEMAAHVLPALRTLTFIDQPSSSAEEFASTRRRAGCPVTIVYPSDPESDEFPEEE